MTLQAQIRDLYTTFVHLSETTEAAYFNSHEPVWGRMERIATFWTQLLAVPDLPETLDKLRFRWLISPEEQRDFDRLMFEVNNNPNEAQSAVVEGFTDLLLHVCRRISDTARRYLNLYGSDDEEDLNPDAIKAVESTVRDLVQKVESARREDSMAEMYERATKAAERAVEARDTIQVTAATVSESELAEHYKKFASAEAKRADWFRGFTIGLITLGIALASFLPNDGTDLKDIIHRLAIIAAVFGLAGYLARQSSHHRRLSVWGDTIAVQLHTFEGYLSPINSDDVREKLRMTFSSRVFSAPPEAKQEQTDSMPSDLLANTLAMLTRQSQPK